MVTSSSFSLFGQGTGLTISTYELPNGMKVYLNPDETASNVYGAVWVNAGGKNDPSDATGIAHYLEHMLFKGTETLGTQNYQKEKIHLDSIKLLYDKLAETDEKETQELLQRKINEQELKAAEYAIPNEFDKLIKSIGSTGVNASTGEDFTNYYNYFPPAQLPKWLDIYAHRFQKPVFRLFQSELEAVYEEKNRAGDNLERRVTEKFNEYIYGEHPYSAQTVLGSIEHLKNPSLNKMYQFYQTYYVPNNMALVLSGNFDPELVKPLISKSFGQLERGEDPVFPSYKPNEFNGRKLVKARITPIKAGFMGYKLVPQAHPDRAALEVIGNMISNENQTGFIDKMTLDNDVIYAGSYQDFMEEDGSTFIFYVPKIFGGSLKKYEEKIKSSFEEIANGNFTADYLQSIKNGVYRNFNLSLENLGSRGRYLGLSFIYGVDHEALLSFPDKVQSLTKEEVQRVAKTYYGENYFTMQSRTGFPKKAKLKKPSYKPIESRTEASSAYATQFDKLPELKSEPNFIDLEEDLTIIDDYIYYTKNPLNDIFTLRLEIARGTAKDSWYPLIASALDNAGTNEYTALELKKAFATLGATYNFSVDYTSFTISLTGLDKEFDETLALLEHLLTQFKPTDKTIDFLHSQRTTDNEINKNNPSMGGRMLYLYGLFGDQSSYKNRLSAKEIKQLKANELNNKLSELLSNGFNSIHYVGQLTRQDIASSFTENALYKRNRVDNYSYMEFKEPKESTIYLVNDKKSIQSYVYYIVNGEPLDKSTYHQKEAFNAYYTNSLSGIVFQEVREFRSLAYSAGGEYFYPAYAPEKDGRLVLFTGSQADKTVDAVEVIVGLLKEMPVYESRMPTIKDGLFLKTGSSKPTFRNLSTTGEAILKTGFEQDPNKLIYGKCDELTFDDIQTFFDETIKNKPMVITIYGDASRFDKDKLRQFGKPVELDMEDIAVE